MKHKIFDKFSSVIAFITLIFVLTFCSDDDSQSPECTLNFPADVEDCSIETLVESSPCILKETISGSGEVSWVYHHDGTNYDQIDYITQWGDDPVLEWMMNLEYDQLNRISRTEKKITQSGNTEEISFNYDDQPYLVLTFRLLDPSGAPTFTDNIEVPYYPIFQDSLYRIDAEVDRPDFPYFIEFENGNQTNWFFRDPDGMCEKSGFTFSVARRYYDNRPNFFSDYAILLSSSFPEQYWYWGNANNVIAAIDDQGNAESICPEYLTNGKGDYWIKRLNNRTYLYDCEE